MTVNEAVQNRIIEICNEKNISINKLCILSGVTQSTVNNILNRTNSSPTVATLKKLCDGADITLSDFFTSNLFDDIDVTL